LDGFEGGDDERGRGVDGDVAGDDAHAPAAGAPFGVFVVGEGAGGDGEQRAAGEIRLLGPALEDVGFAGAGGCVDHNVAAGLEGTDRLGLPAVGEDEFLKAGESVGQHGIERARARRRVKPWPEFLAEIFARRSAADDQPREHRRGVAHPLARMRGAVVF
jgi:hypothetical protein